MSAGKKSRKEQFVAALNERIGSRLAKNRPDLYDALVRLEKEEATAKPEQKVKKIPRSKFAEMKRRCRALEDGESLEVSFGSMLTVTADAFLDRGEGTIDRDTIVLSPPKVAGKTPAHKQVIGRLVEKLHELATSEQDPDDFRDELSDAVHNSPEFKAFSQKVGAFWDEVGDLEEKYDDFDQDDLELIPGL